jgi:hypothetical protein
MQAHRHLITRFELVKLSFRHLQVIVLERVASKRCRLITVRACFLLNRAKLYTLVFRVDNFSQITKAVAMSMIKVGQREYPSG